MRLFGWLRRRPTPPRTTVTPVKWSQESRPEIQREMPPDLEQMPALPYGEGSSVSKFMRRKGGVWGE